MDPSTHHFCFIGIVWFSHVFTLETSKAQKWSAVLLRLYEGNWGTWGPENWPPQNHQKPSWRDHFGSKILGLFSKIICCTFPKHKETDPERARSIHATNLDRPTRPTWKHGNLPTSSVSCFVWLVLLRWQGTNQTRSKAYWNEFVGLFSKTKHPKDAKSNALNCGLLIEWTGLINV